MQINPNYSLYNYPKIQKSDRPHLNNVCCDTVSFKGHAQTEKIFQKGFRQLIHQTGFFREPETDKFVHDYLLKTFGQDETIKIVSGACSTGEEAVTQSMLYYPQKNNVEILGIDLGKKAIKQAKSRRYVFEKPLEMNKVLDYFKNIEASPYADTYLIHENRGLSPDQNHFRALFNEFFKPTNEKIKISLLERLQNRIYKNTYGEEPLKIERKAYKLKEGMGENCRFVQGDIRDIEKLTNGEEQNAIYFKNALYHLTTVDATSDTRIPKKNAEAIIEDLATRFKNCLKDKGVVVFGENEAAQMGDSGTVPKVMERLGFIPKNKTDKHPANVWQINK